MPSYSLLTAIYLTFSMCFYLTDKLPVLAVNEVKTVVHTDIFQELASIVRPFPLIPPFFLQCIVHLRSSNLELLSFHGSRDMIWMKS